MRAPKSFEEGMDRLNTILAQMQQEDTSLADSVKLYAEAASPDAVLPCNVGKDVVADRGNQCKDCRDRGHPQEQEEE